jgi:hypothetical protein
MSTQQPMAGYANTPAPENIARIMNTEVDSAQTDEQDEK